MSSIRPYRENTDSSSSGDQCAPHSASPISSFEDLAASLKLDVMTVKISVLSIAAVLCFLSFIIGVNVSRRFFRRKRVMKNNAFLQQQLKFTSIEHNDSNGSGQPPAERVDALVASTASAAGKTKKASSSSKKKKKASSKKED
jgi:hypothetical protein